MSSWPYFYKQGFTASTNREIAGVHAMKLGLVDNGFSDGINLGVNVFGEAAASRTRDFQRARALTQDGVIGPTTARYLWRRYVHPAETTYGIPDHWLGKLISLESGNDPVAQGTVDPGDEGLVQVHMAYHPELSLSEVWAPKFIVAWAGNVFQRTFVSLQSWKAVVASWNVGLTYARQWSTEGYPSSGGPDLGGEDAFTRASRYVNLVAAQQY